MNCRQFHEYLDDYLDGDMSVPVRVTCTAHLDTCARCRQTLSHESELRSALRSMPVPSPAPGFLDTAVARATQPPAGSRIPWRSMVAGAMAAGLVLWLGASVLLPAHDPGRNHDIADVSMTLHETRTVQLALNSERDLEHATLSIHLPNGVEMQGFPGQSEIRWQTDLARGVNLLSLPLLATGVNEGTLVARLEHGDRSKQLTVRLTIRPDLSGSVDRPIVTGFAVEPASYRYTREGRFMEVNDAFV